MPSRVIPLIDVRHMPHRAASTQPGAAWRTSDPAPPAAQPALPWRDAWGRPLRDLRISVTDRCNFRCGYCMPKSIFSRTHPFLPYDALLSFEEITRLAGLLAKQGIHKIRLTGGEPLLRKHLERLIAQLAALRTPEGQALDLTLTTNGALLAHQASRLKNAGLQRITVSLDALDDAIFRRMNDVDFPVSKVLAGIAAAQAAGLSPIKVNMVVKRGTNDPEIIPVARYFRDHHPDIILRFIEYMDVGTTNGWRMDDVLPGQEIVRRLDTAFGLTPLQNPTDPSAPAQRWAWRDGRGEIGIIASVTQAFCASCSRARLSTDGRLYLCLFAHQGFDLKSLLRGGATDTQIQHAMQAQWQARTDRYSALRHQATEPTPAHTVPHRSGRIEMSYIGG